MFDDTITRGSVLGIAWRCRYRLRGLATAVLAFNIRPFIKSYGDAADGKVPFVTSDEDVGANAPCPDVRS